VTVRRRRQRRPCGTIDGVTFPAGSKVETRNAPARARHAKAGAYRGDIDGLRAVAVMLVVLFHAGWAGLTGGYVGVDVFFVLSGFLITGLLMRELRTTGTISLSGFYARRIRRLLPLSALVLVSTAVASHFLTPALDRPGVGGDIRAAGLYVANWHYAAAATQYMADTDKSPVLHYWSLSVEEQFYVVWPLLILLVVGWTGVARRSWAVAHRRVAVALAVVAGISLLLSATISVSSGPFAYFGLHTRAWELAAGAALALASVRLAPMSGVAGTALGGVGLALVVGSAFLMTDDTVFPGTAALIPVAGTVMALAGGALAPTGPLTRLLSNGGLRYIGRISYSWYLWHWPCLVLLGAVGAQAATDGDDHGAATGAGFSAQLLALALSLALAIASHHLLENPARRARALVQSRPRTLVLGVAITAVSVVASLVPAGPGAAVGGAAGSKGSGGPAGVSVAAAAAARTDTAEIPNGCYRDLDTTDTPTNCLFGDPAGTTSIVLTGDSNARFWFPAYNAMAKQRHWKLYFWGKSGCPIVDGLVWLGKNKAAYDTCTTWRHNVLGQLTSIGHVDAVVLARSRATDQYLMVDKDTRAETGQQQGVWEQALRRTLTALKPIAGSTVLMVPIPSPTVDVPACVAEDPPTAGTRCAFPRSKGLAVGPLDRAEAGVARARSEVEQIDLSGAICPGASCPVTSPTGQVMYLNRNHLTAAYAESLSPVIGKALDRIVR
jgi:peptidoglycan/LPS O-acetylase OafA/YrhL